MVQIDFHKEITENKSEKDLDRIGNALLLNFFKNHPIANKFHLGKSAATVRIIRKEIPATKFIIEIETADKELEKAIHQELLEELQP